MELNAVAVRISNDDDPEKILVKEAVKDLKKLITDQGTIYPKKLH